MQEMSEITAEPQLAIRAAAYLKKHCHALEGSILRRIILGTTVDDDSSEPASYCASCDSPTVSRCLKLLASLSSEQLLIVVKKTAEVLAESETAKVCPPSKTGFKPSLDCKRRPIATNFSFQKMKEVVKEDLSLKRSKTNTEMTLREAAFFNPKPQSKVKRTRKRGEKSSRACDKGGQRIVHIAEVKNQQNAPETSSTSSNLPVPQVKLDHNGQIILDPSSLTVPSRPKSVISCSPEVSTPKTFKWSLKDTVEFYKALHIYGTDFTLMSSVFPNRERKNLKKKFIAEDKKNRDLVDMAIGKSSRTSNMSYIIQQLESENNLKKIR